MRPGLNDSSERIYERIEPMPPRCPARGAGEHHPSRGEQGFRNHLAGGTVMSSRRAPALYVVVHHPDDPSRPYANEWDRVRAGALLTFTTPAKVVRHCVEGEVLYVHRCAFGGRPASIVCEARITSVQPIDRREALVRLEPLRCFDLPPRRSPSRGENCYFAPTPVEEPR